MKRSFRRSLAASHTAAVAIAVLLLWSVVSLFSALSSPAVSLASYLVYAFVTLDFRFYSSNRFMLPTATLFLAIACIEILAAWLLSRWVYGEGPLRALRYAWSNVLRRENV